MSLYQRLGGSEAISAVVDKFYEIMLLDDRLSHYYKQSDLDKLRTRQKQFITMVSGGPNNYKGTDMKTAHCKHSIGHLEFDATWHNLQEALAFFNVPSIEINELKQIFYSVEKQIVNQTQTADNEGKSLYQKLGGQQALHLVVNKFYDIMLNDPRVSFYFANTDMQKQRNSQIQFISMVTGGPNNYTGKDMKAAHCPYNINLFEFDATWENLKIALKTFSVPSNLINDLKEIFFSVKNDIVHQNSEKPAQKKCPLSKPQLSPEKQNKSLFQNLGGHGAVYLVVNKFYDFMLEDSRVNFYFANTNMQKQRDSQVEFISMVTGGPNNYRGKDMKAAHCPYKISHSEFDATWQNLQKSFKYFKVNSVLVEEVKEIFYSVEQDIVVKSAGQILSRPTESDVIKEVTKGVQDMNLMPEGLMPVTLNSVEIRSCPKSHSPGKYKQSDLMKCPHMSSKLKQNVVSEKLSQNEKRKLRQQVIDRQVQKKQVKKLSNNPYQKTYY